MAALLLVFTVFGCRLVQLQGLDSSALAAAALDSRETTHALPADRGDILDRDGLKLATTVERRNVTVDQTLVPAYRQDDKVPVQEKGVAAAAAKLAPILQMTQAELVKDLSGRKRFGYVKKDVEPQVWNDVNALKIPGLFSEQASRRTYPGGSVGASMVGFLSKDGRAMAGIERTENTVLKGTDGALTYERGSGGQQIATGTTTETDPVPGGDVQLTIDMDLQWKVQQGLAKQVKATKSDSGTAVVENIRTGEVLAMADAPTFNANTPGTAKPENLGNRALTDVFEPGSTSKVITAAAALEEGKANPGTHVTVPSTVQRGGKTFHDSHDHAPERLTFAGVLAKSSNVGTIKIGERLAPTTMYDYLTRFGIGRLTHVGLPESGGLLAQPKDWSNSQRYTVLFGQGLSVTALQSASVFATIANDGVRVEPRVIKALPGANGSMVEQPQGKQTRVVSAATARKLRLMLESVVGDDGTAVQAEVPGYRVAGKTGTAQRYDSGCGCYQGYTGSFVGIAPADHPELVVAVYLQNPKNNYYGGTVAAPVFQEVMTYALAKEQVPPSGTKAPKVALEW
jgi:cell division protein FtsI (penicillin-binding protein 3)